MRLFPRPSRLLRSRFIRSWGPVLATLLLTLGSLGLLPSFGGDSSDRPFWSKCGLALCSCLQPLAVAPALDEPECPLCPGYDEPERVHTGSPVIGVRYDASMQLPMSLLVGSVGLIVVLGSRREDETVDPETDLNWQPIERGSASRHLSIETPPPRA